MRKPGVLLCVVLLACTKPKNEAKPDDAAPPPATPIASTRPVDASDQARSTVLKWCDALDRHDLAALESVYAPTIDLYGNTVARAAAIDAKKRAFAAAPTFRQSIVGSIALTPDGEAWVATFTKRSGPAASQKDASAKVVVASGAVTVETDAPSEKKAAAESSCESVAGKAVQDLPQVKKLLDDTKKALGKDEHLGGMGPDPEPGGGFSASIGVHHPDRFESQVVYAVDAKGKLTVMVVGEDVAVPPEAAERLAKACAK